MDKGKFNVNVFIPKNNSLFISIIFIFLLFAVIIYIKPQLFLFLFNDVLGNLLLIGLVAGVGVFDIKWAVGLGAIFIILYQATHIANKKGLEGLEGLEGMTADASGTAIANANANAEGGGEEIIGGGISGGGSGGSAGYGPYKPYFPDLPVYNASAWPQQVINDFIKFEQIHNPTYKFDVNIIQQQASVAEVQYLLKNNKWPWSDEVKKLFRDSMAQNNYVSTNLNASLDNAQSIYNQAAILELLSWNSKEGQFLLNGSIIGHSDNLPANINNVIKCVASMTGGASGNDIKMQKIVYTGYDSLNGSLQSQTSSVEDSDLPSLITGFKFLKGACNPCSALTQPPGYSCPFSIDTGNGADVTPVWQNLWGLNADSASSASAAASDQFPLLNELKREISLATFISDSIDDAVGPNVASTLDSSAPLMGSGTGAGAILTNISDNTDAIMPGNLQDVDYNIPTNMN